MNILNKPRRSGKTTELIYASEATGFPIIACKGDNHAESIKLQAEEMGCVIPEPITLEDFRHGFIMRKPYEAVFIDEGEDLIKEAVEAYTRARIAAITVSIEMTGKPIETEGAEDDGERTD